ncbi:MAG TPA: DUF1080 domain-containing protein, partial [Urbifossiella sp.]
MLRLLTLFAAAVLIALPAATAEDKAKIDLFNGKDLAGWKPKDAKKNKWVVGIAEIDPTKPNAFAPLLPPAANGTNQLINPSPGGTDILTEKNFGDMLLEIEFMIPKGSNSGIYMMGEYEVQIYDTYGKKELKIGDMGSIYTYAAPSVDACKKSGEWQKFVIDFQAPKFEGNKKVANGKFIKVTFNDKVIH